MENTAILINGSNQKIFRVLTKSTIKLISAGIIIGVFYSYDYYLAIGLSVYLAYVLIKKKPEPRNEKRVFIIGAIITGILGMICEIWGIYFGHWHYHDLPNNRQFPYWLPFAWALAFTFIYKIEKEIIQTKKINSYLLKMILALLIAMIFPTIGEMVTINLGVWTYNWPMQILGVPVLAIFLLMVFHMGVNLMLVLICYQMGWTDPVFRK